MKLFKINNIFSLPRAEYLSRSSFADHAASASSQVFKKIYFTNSFKTFGSFGLSLNSDLTSIYRSGP